MRTPKQWVGVDGTAAVTDRAGLQQRSWPSRIANPHPRAGNIRGLRSTAADTSDTSTPTGKISTNVIGSRNIGLAYSVLNDSLCARSSANAAASAPQIGRAHV